MPLWARIIIALVVGNGLGYAAYMRFKNESGGEPAHADAPLVAETKISFASTPSGAKVSEQGVVLGITPFIRTYPRMPSGQGREFFFELDGHTAAKVQAFLDQERIYVHTSLSPLPVQTQPAALVTKEEPQPQPQAQAQAQVQAQAQAQPSRRSRTVSRSVARVQDEPRMAVVKLDSESRDVPKLDDRSAVPKITDEEGSTPKLTDEERRVPKLDEDPRRVPKVDDDGPHRTTKAGRHVPKLKE